MNGVLRVMLVVLETSLHEWSMRQRKYPGPPMAVLYALAFGSFHLSIFIGPVY